MKRILNKLRHKTAKLINDNLEGYGGDARLYKLSKPLAGYEVSGENSFKD
jgi:hypothetical protein